MSPDAEPMKAGRLYKAMLDDELKPVWESMLDTDLLNKFAPDETKRSAVKIG